MHFHSLCIGEHKCTALWDQFLKFIEITVDHVQQFCFEGGIAVIQSTGYFCISAARKYAERRQNCVKSPLLSDTHVYPIFQIQIHFCYTCTNDYSLPAFKHATVALRQQRQTHTHTHTHTPLPPIPP